MYLLVSVSLVPLSPCHLTFYFDEASCLTWPCVCGPSSHSRPPRNTTRYERRLYVWQRPWPWPETDSHWAAGLLQCSPGLHGEGEDERPIGYAGMSWTAAILDAVQTDLWPEFPFERRTAKVSEEASSDLVLWKTTLLVSITSFSPLVTLDKELGGVYVNLCCLSRAPSQIVCFAPREC